MPKRCKHPHSTIEQISQEVDAFVCDECGEIVTKFTPDKATEEKYNLLYENYNKLFREICYVLGIDYLSSNIEDVLNEVKSQTSLYRLPK